MQASTNSVSGRFQLASNVLFSKISSDMSPLEYSPVPVDHTLDELIITPEAVERSLSAVREGKSPWI